MVISPETGRKSYEDYLKEHNDKLQSFTEKIQDSQNIIDLRTAWMENGLVNQIAGYVDKEVFDSFQSSVTRKLTELEINWDSDDERIQMLKEALAHGEEPSDQGTVEMGWHSNVSSHLYRFLTACDPSVQEGLRLLPMEDLTPEQLRIRKKALEFTASDEYTIPDRFPRKAARRITDPTSPFWGFSFKTDTWPINFGGHGSGPNIYLWMPTGLVSKQDIIDTTERGYEKSGMEKDPYYFPRSIIVQSLHLGYRDPGSRQVDTESGMVKKFLDTIEVETESNGPPITL